jgi:hypothetical protein
VFFFCAKAERVRRKESAKSIGFILAIDWSSAEIYLLIKVYAINNSKRQLWLISVPKCL